MAEVGYVPSDPNAKTPALMANQNLSWEKTTQWNFGLDFSFLNGRLGGALDVYTTKTKDLLMSTTIPSLNGYVSTMANVGETSGWGIDLQINALPVKTKDFEWSSVLSWSLDRNKIEKLANGVTENINKNWFVGEEIGVYYDYVYDGIWKTSEAEQAATYGRKPGQIKVKDLNGDGKIDGNNDRAIVGNAVPVGQAVGETPLLISRLSFHSSSIHVGSLWFLQVLPTLTVAMLCAVLTTG